MVAPPRASHSFENASATEEAEVYMTATPGEFPNAKAKQKARRSLTRCQDTTLIVSCEQGEKLD